MPKKTLLVAKPENMPYQIFSCGAFKMLHGRMADKYFKLIVNDIDLIIVMEFCTCDKCTEE